MNSGKLPFIFEYTDWLEEVLFLQSVYSFYKLQGETTSTSQKHSSWFRISQGIHPLFLNSLGVIFS